jgi:hypothetical protein
VIRTSITVHQDIVDGTWWDSRLTYDTTLAVFANVAESQEFLGDTRRGLPRRCDETSELRQ